jgi:hypothetical protein
MAGDIFSSFLKRRFRLPASSKATGLDQIPEALFPLLACSSMLSFGITDVVVGVAVFFLGSFVVSRLSYRLGIRDHPY